MRIDKIESVWENLEQSFARSKVESRRDFAKGLVHFTGQAGSVKILESQLKVDLDTSMETTLRYRAICNMLEAAERWLLLNDTEIPDLNEWFDKLQDSSKFDESKIKTRYVTGSNQRTLLDNVHLGYVFPGMYKQSERMTFNCKMPNYLFLNSAQDLTKELPVLLQTKVAETDYFTPQVIQILYDRFSSNQLTFPCVFVAESLLNQPVVKLHRQKTVKETVALMPGNPAQVDLDYDEGLVEISVGTKLTTYIIRG